MPFNHVTKEQRFKIQSWIEIGMRPAEIAHRLGKHRSTIGRELHHRNLHGHYNALHAHKLKQVRRKEGRRRTKKLVKNQQLRRAVLRRLREQDSPEQIAGKRKRNQLAYVVHETLYQYLYTERPDLISLLRQKKGKYRRRHGTRLREKQREHDKKTWITERPEHINNRTVMGHWEGDTVRGKGCSGSIATHVERVSGYGLGAKLENLTAREMHVKTVEQFKKIPKDKRRSETDDNGVEFSDFEYTERELNMKIYFALPYHSWERGTNENFNGLLRQFFPKGTSFAMVTQQDVDQAIYKLNHRPRKRLNYLSPHEVFVQGKKP